GKPVVACNIAQSTNYILQSEESFIDGIKTALDGRNQIGKKRFWESDSESKLLEAVNIILSSTNANTRTNNELGEKT
ncbi:MAG: hypothetical protein ACREAD_06870, partial [Nitrosopumilaceae archaeon]